MTDLITRIEQADGPRRELFDEAYGAIHGAPIITLMMRDGSANARTIAFLRMLDAEAWTSAAEMLVPEGCLHMARTVWENADAPLDRAVGYASVDRYFRDEQGLMWKENFLTTAAHPSLALLAAILRAERNEP